MPRLLKLIRLVILICAIQNVKSIYDGILARPQMFPFLVAITDKNHHVKCSGTLITEWKVLSTGLCFTGDYTNAFVEAGSVDLYCEYINEHKQVQEIYHVVRHPGIVYNPENEFGINLAWGADIVIVTVKTAFQKTSYVSPISIFRDFLDPGASLIVAGFGEFAPDKIDGKARYVNCKLAKYNRDSWNRIREVIGEVKHLFANADTGGPIVNIFSRKDLLSLYHHHDGDSRIVGIGLASDFNIEFIDKQINRNFTSPRRRSGQKDIFDGRCEYFLIINMYLVSVMFTRCLSTFN